MPYEQLIESVEVSAGERIREIKESVYSKSMEIIKEAQAKDEAIKKRHL